MEDQKLQEVLEFFKSMSEAETEMSALYEACQQRWPEIEEWGAIRVQELQHAGSALRLKTLVAASPDSFLPLRPLNSRNVDFFISSVRAVAEKVRTRAYTLLQALAAVKDVEQSVLESRYDQLLSTRSQEYNRIIEVLQRETREHREMLQRRLLQLGDKK